jgi:hypothetical protein
MAQQLHHLINLSRRRNISVRVIPADVGPHPGLVGQFVILDFRDDPAVVHIEDRATGLFLDDPAHVASYRLALKRLTDVALDEQDTVRLMSSIARDLDRE